MKTFINLLSVIPIRKEPAHRSEMVSQLLFGEYAEGLEEENDFVKIKCLYDDYEGWVQASQLTEVKNIFQTQNYVGAWCGKVQVNGYINNVPFCSPVYPTPGNEMDFENKKVKYMLDQHSLWDSTSQQMNPKSIEIIYSKFLDTPYLWGGKSVFGIDCSGFAQQVFKMFGIKLLRDAYLQATQGAPVGSLHEAAFGDLAFFSNENGRVTHVGIILNDQKIIHASGKVRIDCLDEQGIMNSENSKRTHQLHSIRRFL